MGRTLVLTVFLVSAISLSSNSALADTFKSNPTDTVKQAAQEVVKDTGAKEQFGKSKNGNELLDQAQNKANENLNNLAQEANSNQKIPASKKMFLDNLTSKND